METERIRAVAGRGCADLKSTEYYSYNNEEGRLPEAFVKMLRSLEAVVFAEKRNDEILP